MSSEICSGEGAATFAGDTEALSGTGTDGDVLRQTVEVQREEPVHLVRHELERLYAQTEEFHLLLIHLAEKDLLHEQGWPQALVQLALA